MGSVHFFSINNTQYEPDGYKYPSTQASWLQAGLAASDSAFNIVLMHYPAYSSGSIHGSQPSAQWPFEAWGATAVISGHDHDYERILRDDNGDGQTMPYFVAGLGGFGRYRFSYPRRRKSNSLQFRLRGDADPGQRRNDHIRVLVGRQWRHAHRQLHDRPGRRGSTPGRRRRHDERQFEYETI